MNIYRIHRRKAGTDDPFVPTTDKKVYTDLTTAAVTAESIQTTNDAWAKAGAPDHEYRVFATRVSDDQFIPVT